MLGAAAWYTLYQNQEQARESARQYALTIDWGLQHGTRCTRIRSRPGSLRASMH
ncbi:phage tail tape measure protein [Escherichia coli]|uniref:phage tail tape measure protein n=1 Tax=Escherichia coli TaxID=562 RepID=UPI00352C022C